MYLFMKIIVDADACPRMVLQICFALGKEYKVPVWTVASINHQIDSEHHIVVDSGPQEADLKILNITEVGDIIVTQDWGLASMVLAKPAKCLSPSGREFLAEGIEFLMEERETKAKLRRSGGRTKGPKKHTAKNDRNFEGSLRRILDEVTKTARID